MITTTILLIIFCLGGYKTGEILVKIINKYMFKKTKEKDYVFCEDCGIAIKREKAYEVEENFYRNIPGDIKNMTKKYYCEKHKKPYDFKKLSDPFFGKPEYYKTMIEVDEKGKVIK